MNEIELVAAAGHLGELSSRLRDAAPNETAAILLCHVHDTPSRRRRVLVREVLDIPQQFYREQQPDRVSIDPIFLAHVFRRARHEESSILLAHTHPFSRWPEFSLVDDHGEARLIPVIFGRVEKRPHGSLVLGEEGFSARLYSTADCAQPIRTLVSIGRDLWQNTKEDPSVSIDSMHDRNVRAFGGGQQKLQRIRVGIAGLGGIGSLIAEQLAHLGVRSLTLVDFDQLERSNLNRVVGASRKDVGAPKVEVTKRLVHRINPGIRVESVHGSILI